MNKRYCTVCGVELLKEPIDAGTITWCSMDGVSIQPYDNYDAETGERTPAFKYTCPKNKGLKWYQFGNHDSYELVETLKKPSTNTLQNTKL